MNVIQSIILQYHMDVLSIVFEFSDIRGKATLAAVNKRFYGIYCAHMRRTRPALKSVTLALRRGRRVNINHFTVALVDVLCNAAVRGDLGAIKKYSPQIQSDHAAAMMNCAIHAERVNVVRYLRGFFELMPQHFINAAALGGNPEIYGLLRPDYLIEDEVNMMVLSQTSSILQENKPRIEYYRHSAARLAIKVNNQAALKLLFKTFKPHDDYTIHDMVAATGVRADVVKFCKNLN